MTASLVLGVVPNEKPLSLGWGFSLTSSLYIDTSAQLIQAS